MYRKMVLLLGTAAIIALLLTPPTYKENILVNPQGAFTWEKYDVVIKTDYNKLALRAAAIIIGFGVVFFMVPSDKKRFSKDI